MVDYTCINIYSTFYVWFDFAILSKTEGWRYVGMGYTYGGSQNCVGYTNRTSNLGGASIFQHLPRKQLWRGICYQPLRANFLAQKKRSPTNLPNFEARGALIAGFYGKWKGWMVGMGRFWMMMLTFRVYKCSNLPDSQEGAATVLPFLPFFQTFCCRWDLLPTCGWETCRFADGSWGPKRSKAGKEGKPETSAPVLLLNTGFDQILP